MRFGSGDGIASRTSASRRVRPRLAELAWRVQQPPGWLPGFEEVEGGGVADLADDDAVGAGAEGVLDGLLPGEADVGFDVEG